MVGVGKEILIKTVEKAVPTYSMNCFLLPSELCKHIDIMLRKFFRVSKNGVIKVDWVSWDVFTMPKYIGGGGGSDSEMHSYLARQCFPSRHGDYSRSQTL